MQSNRDKKMDLYHAGMKFKKTAKWRQAAEGQVKCAVEMQRQKKTLAAAIIYANCVEDFMKSDKSEALKTLQLSIALYCQLGQFGVAGKLQVKLAKMHFDGKHWEEAALAYKKASNFLSGEQCIDEADFCLEQAAFCFLELKEYMKAYFVFMQLAESAAITNLKCFNARFFLFKAILCHVAIKVVPPVMEKEKVDKKGRRHSDAVKEKKSKPTAEELEKENDIFQEAGDLKYEMIHCKIDDFKSVDFMWPTSKEVLFLRNLIDTRLTYNYTEFVNHLYFWNNVRPFDRHSLVMIKVMDDEFILEKARVAEKARVETRAIERARLKAEKMAKQKLAIQMIKAEQEAGGGNAEGLNDQNIVIDEDELERELDVIDMAKKEKYEEEHGQGADAALREKFHEEIEGEADVVGEAEAEVLGERQAQKEKAAEDRAARRAKEAADKGQGEVRRRKAK